MRCSICDARLATLLLQLCCLGLLLAIVLPSGTLALHFGSPWLWAVAAPASALGVHAALVHRRMRRS